MITMIERRKVVRASLFSVILTMILSCLGCGAPLMAEVKKMGKPDPDHAIVTFIRSSVMSPTLNAELWDREIPIGELGPRDFIQYKAAPGRHLFLSKSGSWSYLEANLITGEHYVVKIKVFPGGHVARLELVPLTPKSGDADMEDIEEWLADLTGKSIIDETAEKYVKPRLAELKKAIKLHDDGKTTFEVLQPEDFWPISP